MKIMPRSLAVFWRLPGSGPVQQFHADMYPMPGEGVPEVLARFRAMFPRDIVCSVRDSRGRFLPFHRRLYG